MFILHLLAGLKKLTIAFLGPCLSVLLALVAFGVNAQSYYLDLKIYPTESSFSKKAQLSGSFKDSLSVTSKIADVLSEAHESGFLLAEISSVRWDGKKAFVSLDLRTHYKISKLLNGNIPERIFQKFRHVQAGTLKPNYSTIEVKEIIEEILAEYLNNGYPFASVYLDSIKFQDSGIEAKLFSSPGKMFFMDSLVVAGDLKISASFLQSFLDIETGSVYNEAKINSIEKRLQELYFIKSVKKPQLKFSADRAKLQLYLEKENANQFDGILGFLPDNTTGKLQLTGDIRLHLENAFKRAEVLTFSFKGLPGKSRELNMAAGFSELFSTPIGLDFNFTLFKQDTAFQNVVSRIGLNYRINNGRFSVFVQNRNGSPINSTANSASLPAFANVKYLSYGSGWAYRTVNSRIAPTKGFILELEAEAGRKTVSESTVTAANRDSVSLKSSQYRLKSLLEVYFPISARSVLKLGNQTGLLLGNEFFENELYRIGGFRNLRGFDEQSILTTNFSVFNLEYRLLIERTSFLFAFINQGIVSNTSIKTKYKDTPLGFGAGINLQTKAGLFSLSYALGKQKDNPLNLQRGKIHFGLVTLF